MGPMPVCPDANTPFAPGGRVKRIPGDNRANKSAVTMISVLVRTMFIARAIKEYTMINTNI